MKFAILAAVIFVLLVSTVWGGSYVSYYNYGNTTEKQLQATMNNNQNILTQYTDKVSEVAQVPSMYKKDLTDLIQKTMEARYGDKGSQATWQWLKEQNPKLDPKLYSKIQDVVEAGRTQFQDNQTLLIDQKRSYQTALGSFWGGFWLKHAGYPKIDLNSIKIISSTRTNSIYQTEVDNGLKISN